MKLEKKGNCGTAGEVNVTGKDIACSNEGCGSRATKIIGVSYEGINSFKGTTDLHLRPMYALCPKCYKTLISKILTPKD